MQLKLLGRLAGVLALTAGLAGCIDMTAEVEVLSETTGKATTVTTMGGEFYPMIKAMAAQTAAGGQGAATMDGFCEAEGEVLVENDDDSATCTGVREGEFAALITPDGPTENATFTVVSPGVVRVAFKTEGMASELTDGQDAEMAAMMQTYFEGHNATLRVKGRRIVDSNMTISQDGTSAEIVIPFASLMDGSAQLPDELFAVVDTD